MDYKIIRSNSLSTIQAEVKQAMADGYLPQGGVATGNLELYQAMVRTSGSTSADASAPQGGRRRTRRYRS